MQSQIIGIQIHTVNNRPLTDIQLKTKLSFEQVKALTSELCANVEASYQPTDQGWAVVGIKSYGDELTNSAICGKGKIGYAGLIGILQCKTRMLRAKRRITELDKCNEKSRMDAMGISFHIDSIAIELSRGCIVIRGWVYSTKGYVSVKSTEFEYNVVRFSRPELKEIFHSEAAEENTGFELRLYPNIDNGKSLSFFMDDGSSKFVLQYRIDNENIGNAKHQAYAMYEELKINNNRLPLPALSDRNTKNIFCKKTVSVIIPICVEDDSQKSMLEDSMRSIRKQSYSNTEIILVGKCYSRLKKNELIRYIESDTASYEELLIKGIQEATGEYMCFMEANGIADPDWIYCMVSEIAQKHRAVFCDYDVWYQGRPEVIVRRDEHYYNYESVYNVLTAVMLERKLISTCGTLREVIKQIADMDSEQVSHSTELLYHSKLTRDAWNKGNTRPIAFYLTQFHENEENNQWWGQGFTEWTNVRRAVPQFAGHHQPRIPLKMNYYDLVEDHTIFPNQILAAATHGICGFCFYYYWFAGKRLLRKPLDIYIENKKFDFPYCICWANESWTRRWDGKDEEILMEQVHNEETDEQFIRDIIPMLKDDRYIRVKGKPLLLIYRIDLLKNSRETIHRWKKICFDEGVGEIHVAMIQSFDNTDPNYYGADSAVEFPPHKIGGRLVKQKPKGLKDDFAGNIYSYKDMVERLSVVKRRDYNMFAGSMLEWDNTARRMEKANIYTDFSPELFRKWMIRNHVYTRLYGQDGIMFINAWNEWAEGTCLEPEEKYGLELLDIVKEITALS